jgi:hypothetical protein
MRSIDLISITPDEESTEGEKIDLLHALPLPIDCDRNP